MKVNAEIRVINEKMEGVSKLNGMPWVNQKLHIAWQEPYDAEGHAFEQLLVVKLRGEDVNRLEQRGLKVGDVIEGDLRFGLRRAGNYVDNDVVMRLL